MQHIWVLKRHWQGQECYISCREGISDIEIEYLMKDIGNTFNFRNFPNVLRAYANYDDREFPGLTKTMGYAGSFGSSSSMHFEDFNSNALNLLIFGAEKLWKCWRGSNCTISMLDNIINNIHTHSNMDKTDNNIFHSDQQDEIIKLGENIVNDLKKNRKKNKTVKVSCSKPFLDKLFILSSKVTRENDLPYTLLIQKPGDMVITFPRAFHAVTNAGFNFAVAVKFGFMSFLKDALLYEGCSWYVK